MAFSYDISLGLGAEININLRTLALLVAIPLLFNPLLDYLTQIQWRFTTLGVLSSWKECLIKLPNTLRNTNSFQERHQCLSDDSREQLKQFDRARARCLFLLDDLENRHRSTPFLYWRSAKFRKDLVAARKDVRKLEENVDAVEEEVVRWIRTHGLTT